MRIAPSILAADMADLGGAVGVCQEGEADRVHVDVMDGHFVPNLTIGIPVVAALRRRTDLPLDVHLMVREPERLLDRYLEAGADALTVHWEAAVHLDRLLSQIRERGARAGVALNPATPVELLVDVLPALDLVLLMSVNPGFSGQTFLPGSLAKARRLRGLLDASGSRVEIAMDGGIGLDNIRQVAEAGVDTVIAGSAVFGADDPRAAIVDLRRRGESGNP